MTVEELIEELKRFDPKDKVKVVRVIYSHVGSDEQALRIDSIRRDNGDREPVSIEAS